ncbi:MAG: insulinase family protein [Candidatus Pacebacteria bacterium]|nr:insulinase family protein [Candidatus Paceibacterota bacterium]
MFQKTTLANNLRIITVPMKNTKAVTVLVLVGAGSKCETKDVNGISHFLEHMFFKGTKKRPTFFKVNEVIDRIGGAQNAFTGKDYTGYHVTFNSKHIDLCLDWISDMLLNSRFEEKEIEKEKGVIIEEINYIMDTPIIYIQDLWEKLLYKDQPAGWLISGEKQNIIDMKKSDFLNYLNDYYSSKNTIVCVAGDINSKCVKEKIAQHFKSINTSDPKQKQKVIEKQNEPDVFLNFKKTDQTHMALGVRTYNLFDDRKYVLAILGKILGGMMSSRLFIEVREKHGLAYYVHTQVELNPDTGYLVTFAGIDNKNIEKAIKIILKEYKKLCKEKVSNIELEKAKENIKGKMILKLESCSAQALFHAEQEMFKKEILTPEQIFKKIDEITANDIINTAQDIFAPEKLNLTLIGPFKNKEKFQKLLTM